MQPEEDTLPNKILKSSCFSVQTHQELSTICAQPMSKLDLSAFEFVRVYDDGTAIILYSDPRIAKYVIENQLHIAAHIPETILSSQFWYLPEHNSPYSNYIRDIKELSGSNSFANYIQRFSGYFEMYSFLAPLDQSLATNYFMNSKESLEQFSFNFRDTAKDLILSADLDRFNFTQKMATNFGGLGTHENAADNSHLRLYLEKIQQELTTFGARVFPNLTNRELECIKLLMLGNTANDMADKMGISQRTVEMHLNSTRYKLGCAKKSDILSTMLQYFDTKPHY